MVCLLSPGLSRLEGGKWASMREITRQLLASGPNSRRITPRFSVYDEDARAARQLIGEKAGFREIETRVTEAHFGEVRSGRRRDCISTSCAT